MSEIEFEYCGKERFKGMSGFSETAGRATPALVVSTGLNPSRELRHRLDAATRLATSHVPIEAHLFNPYLASSATSRFSANP